MLPPHIRLPARRLFSTTSSLAARKYPPRPPTFTAERPDPEVPEVAALALATSTLQLSRYQLQLIRLLATQQQHLVQCLNGPKVGKLKTVKFKELRQVAVAVERFHKELGTLRDDRRVAWKDEEPEKRWKRGSKAKTEEVENGEGEVDERGNRIGEWEKRIIKVESVLERLLKEGIKADEPAQPNAKGAHVERRNKARDVDMSNENSEGSESNGGDFGAQDQNHERQRGGEQYGTGRDMSGHRSGDRYGKDRSFGGQRGGQRGGDTFGRDDQRSDAKRSHGEDRPSYRGRRD